MDFLKNIKEDSILLIPNNIKDKILEYINENKLLINIKFLTLNDLKKGLFYDYNDETIYKLMKNNGISYSVAKSYIEDTYYLDKDSYDNKKLNDLLQIKNFLIDNNLLVKDELFIDLLRSKSKMYVFGFDYLSKYDKYLLNIAKNYITVDESNNKEYKEYEHTVYEANYIDDEVIFVAENISKLIKDGISLNKIFIAGIDDEYDYSMRRIFKEYGIPYFIKNENILYDTVIAKDFFNHLNDNIEDSLKYIKSKYNVEKNELNNTIYNKLISLINKFFWADSYTEVKELMIEEAKKTTLPSIHYESEIKTTEIINNIFNDDEYVFLMNFNMGKFPSIKKDEDYIDDNIKPDFMDTSKDYNVNMKNVLLKVLKSIKNLTISYKNNSITQKFYPSFLIKGNFKEEKINNKYSLFSENVNKQLFTNLIDNYIKFNEYNENLPIMNNTYSLDYNTYDNKFTGINSKIDNLNYSYSNITEYYKCPFRFLCSKVYKIDEYESTFDSFIGSLFHKVLEECIDSNKDVDTIYDEYINEHKNDIEFKNYNKFFIEKLRPEMHTVVDLINKQYEFINKTSEIHEAKIEKHASELNLHTKIDAVIKGFVDKILYINDNVIIIDYKTGSSDKIMKERFEYGLTVQLPIYMYLLETINPNLNVTGIYLQKILNLSIKKDKKKTEEELKLENLKLQGLTLNDEEILPDIDSEYESSKIIQSLKVTKTTGELKGQLYSYEDKEDFKQKIEKVITDCINNVYDAEFPISPYKIDKDTGCSYCSFKDICFKNENQYKIIKIEKESKEGEQ